MTLATDFTLHLRTRNNARILQFGSFGVALGLFCLTPLLPKPEQKLFAAVPGAALATLSLLAGRDHFWADRKVRSFVSAEDGGYRQSLVATFMGNKGMGTPAAQLEAEVIDDDPTAIIITEILEMEDEIASGILLGLYRCGVEVTAASISDRRENEAGVGYLVELPAKVSPSVVAKKAADIQAFGDLPVLPVITPTRTGVSVILPCPKLEAGVDVAAPVVDAPRGEAVAVEAREQQSDRLPDGAVLISPKALNNINRYPVVFVIAGQGSGKTATMGAILHSLEGKKIVASPKPLAGTMQAIADLIFGFDPDEKQWRYFGDPLLTEFNDERDLTWHLNNSDKTAGSMLDYCHAAQRESANRQTDPTHDRTPMRCFFDECAETFLMGFSDMMLAPTLNKKRIAMGQQIVSNCNKNSLLNWRGQGSQHFIGAQTETVSTIGLEKFAAAKDEGWFLFPGIAAITKAQSLGKYQLANWMQRRVDGGFGVALLAKQDSIFEVINLPSIDVLDKFSK